MDSEHSFTIFEGGDAGVDDSNSDRQFRSPFILPPSAEEAMRKDGVTAVIFRAIQSVRDYFTERDLVPPDDFEILLLLTYGLNAKDVKALTRVQCTELEHEIRQRQDRDESTEAIIAFVKSFMSKSVTQIAPPNVPRDTRLEIFDTPTFGAKVSSQDGGSAWFLHSYQAFMGYGLPTYLVYTEDGCIEEWSAKYVHVDPNQPCRNDVHQTAYPINADVRVVKSMYVLGFPAGRAKIAATKIENGVVKILVRHPQNKKNEHGDVIEDWVTPDKISRS